MLALVLLIGTTVWAFSGPTTSPRGHANAAGIRVDPSAAYYPVLAGERLPEGFRQLLPRDAIQPIYEPEFAAASQIAWPAATDVIGVSLGGEAKAYPVSFLGGRELVIDHIGGIPILV